MGFGERTGKSPRGGMVIAYLSLTGDYELTNTSRKATIADFVDKEQE